MSYSSGRMPYPYPAAFPEHNGPGLSGSPGPASPATSHDKRNGASYGFQVGLSLSFPVTWTYLTGYLREMSESAGRDKADKRIARRPQVDLTVRPESQSRSVSPLPDRHESTADFEDGPRWEMVIPKAPRPGRAVSPQKFAQSQIPQLPNRETTSFLPQLTAPPVADQPGERAATSVTTWGDGATTSSSAVGQQDPVEDAGESVSEAEQPLFTAYMGQPRKTRAAEESSGMFAAADRSGRLPLLAVVGMCLFIVAGLVLLLIAGGGK